MRKILATAALLLAFSFPALAGEMGTPGAPAPPANAEQEPTGGIIQTGVAQIALDLLAVLPSLL